MLTGANLIVRPYRPEDLQPIKCLTVEAFAGVTLEQNIEQALGLLAGHDWRWRKARHIHDDVAANPNGIFVAESKGQVIGYITTQIDREAGKGRIPNLAVVEKFRGQGVARQLIQRALDYFRGQRLEYAVIETMTQNLAGNYVYPACGFIEVARQVHFARRL